MGLTGRPRVSIFELLLIIINSIPQRSAHFAIKISFCKTFFSQKDTNTCRKYKQIDSLRQYFPTVKEVTKDALYEIPTPLPNRKLITLRV